MGESLVYSECLYIFPEDIIFTLFSHVSLPGDQ